MNKRFKKRGSNKTLKWVERIMISLVCFFIIISTVFIYGRIQELAEEEQKFETMRISVAEAATQNRVEMIEENEIQTERQMLEEYRHLYEENPDFAGWISIVGTQIDYPVMQKLEDREYYLHRDFSGRKAYAGVPFVGDGDLNLEGGDVFLYGHNMKNGSMFADLLKYRNKEYWEAHRMIQLDSLWEHGYYEIFSVFYVTEDEWSQEEGLFYKVHKKLLLERNEFLEKLKRIGQYETGTIPAIDDSLIFLITCSYQKKDGRFVVVGRRIQDAS